ncbi:MAG: hypothetical protein AB9856_03640 [Cellulosilyticaceae bacterium]
MIKSTTCCNSKAFTWEINGDNVIIHRIFKNGPQKDIIPLSTFEHLNHYVSQKGAITLSNNLDKAKHTPQEDGMGTFLMQNYDYNTSNAQIASQIAAIMCQVGVWSTNNKKKNIEFYSIINTCKPTILNYYSEKSTL